MTSYTKTGTFALLTAALTLAACTNVKKAAKQFDEGTKYQAEPEVLELHGDSVEYQVTIEIEPGKLNKKTTVEINPTLEYGDQEKARPQVVIQGEKAKGKNKGANTIQSSEGGTVTFKDKFKYEPAMRTSELKAKPKVYMNGYDPVQNQCTDGPVVTIANGIVTTSELANNGEVILESGDPYEPIFKNVEIEVYYLINSSRFNPYFRVKSAGINNSDQIAKLKELGKDTVYQIKGITINGFASPDGELAKNEELSNDRAKSTFNYLKKKLKSLGFSEVHDSAFSMNSSMKEDWAGWKALVQASDLGDKDAILAIMNSSKGDEVKEAEIKANHAKSYDIMKNDMLPMLRRAEISFNRQQPLKNDPELLALNNNLDELDPIELMQLARLQEKPEDKIRIYEHVAKKYPNDWRGFNNLGYVYLMTGDVDKAMANLTRANSLESNKIVLNNMGVASAMQKDYANAEKYYTSAKESGQDEDVNMGLLEFRKGDYDKALDYLKKNKCATNTAIAYIMKGDYSSAKASLDCVEDKDASYYYLYAVVGARTNNLEMVTTNLTRSIQIDAAMRDRAESDLEFRRVSDSAEFKNAIR